MRLLRTNTATRITVGPFLDKTDGITPETALTVTSCKLTLMVDSSGVPTLVLDTNPTASGGANDMVHVTGDDSGFYDLELAAADVNHLGRAILALTDAATHCPVFHEFMIVPAMIYDSMVLGTDRLDTNVTHINDTAQTAGDAVDKLDSALATLAAILSLVGSIFTHDGTAQAGAASTITLDTGASSSDDFYNYQMISIVSGTGVGQARQIADYTGASRIVTVDRAWVTNPNNTSVFVITPADKFAATALETADAILARNVSGGSSTGRTVSQALHALRNKWTNSAGVYTVYGTDDTTPSWTATISSDAGAEPIVGTDPA